MGRRPLVLAVPVLVGAVLAGYAHSMAGHG